VGLRPTFPSLAQLVEHLTVVVYRYQNVTRSIRVTRKGCEATDWKGCEATDWKECDLEKFALLMR